MKKCLTGRNGSEDTWGRENGCSKNSRPILLSISKPIFLFFVGVTQKLKTQSNPLRNTNAFHTNKIFSTFSWYIPIVDHTLMVKDDFIYVNTVLKELNWILRQILSSIFLIISKGKSHFIAYLSLFNAFLDLVIYVFQVIIIWKIFAYLLK